MAREITILSGKGGAGKTVITAALASLATNSVFCDNDVDAADLHLIFNPVIKEEHRFSSGNVAFINSDACTDCGICLNTCRFGAIHKKMSDLPVINEFQCEGCRLCERLCPENAIDVIHHENNNWFVSDSRFGKLVHAQMGPGEENSGKLVTQIRNKARELALQMNAGFIINDGPPGIGCTAISAITGADTVLLIAEPTISGLHDLKRLFELTQSFKIPVLAVINKYDINAKATHKTEIFLKENNIPLSGKIPFDTRVVESIIEGKTMPEFAPDSNFTEQMKLVWKKLVNFGALR